MLLGCQRSLKNQNTSVLFGALSGVVTQGSHDASRADYVYETDKAGYGTVAEARVLDDVEATSPIIERFHGVPHGRLMIDSQILSYFTRELSDQPMMSKLGRFLCEPVPNLN
jgi:hypothetical protein